MFIAWFSRRFAYVFAGRKFRLRDLCLERLPRTATYIDARG
jgi:hypothetical protein